MWPAHGVEARYPFLDARLVQEYLWLSADVKNAEYKAPLHDAFVQWGYPFERRTKQGFAARANLLPEQSMVWRFNAHAPTACGQPPPLPETVAVCSWPIEDVEAETAAEFSAEAGQQAASLQRPPQRPRQPHCELRCVDGNPPAVDSLRCSLHGLWVGSFACNRGIAGLRATALWGGSQGPPRPPRIIDQVVRAT